MPHDDISKASPSLFAAKTRRKAKARRIFLYFSVVSSKNFEPSWLLAAKSQVRWQVQFFLFSPNSSAWLTDKS